MSDYNAAHHLADLLELSKAQSRIEALEAENAELKAVLGEASESLHCLVGETLGGDGAVERGEVAPRGSYNAWISWNERWAARKCCRSIDAVLTR